MKQYEMDGVTLDIEFTPNDLIRVPFQEDGQSRQVYTGSLTVEPEGVITIEIRTRDGLMRLTNRVTDKWEIREVIRQAAPPGIHIGGKVTGNNVNIGGIQNLGGKDKG